MTVRFGQAGGIDIALLLVLAVLWSSSFALIKVAVDTVPPATVAAGRLALAALLLAAIMRVRDLRYPDCPWIWMKFALVGLFGNALPFALIGWGEVTIDSGLAAILMAVMPLTTLLLAHMFTSDEKMTATRIVGVGLGLVGVLILIGPATLEGLGDQAMRQTAVAAGAVCYAISTVVAKKLPPMPHSVSASGTMIAAAAWAIPASVLVDWPLAEVPSFESAISVVLLGLFPTAFAVLIFFALLQRTGATFIALNNYLVPSLGVVWGILFLGEDPSLRAFLALCVILAGIAVTRIGMRQPGLAFPAQLTPIAEPVSVARRTPER